MSIAIDEKKCTGCGRCIEICPGGIIKRNQNHQAFLKRPQDCWSCGSCLKVCSAEAVFMYLPAELGGRGGRMTLRKKGRRMEWTVIRRDGSSVTLTTSADAANRY